MLKMISEQKPWNFILRTMCPFSFYFCAIRATMKLVEFYQYSNENAAIWSIVLLIQSQQRFLFSSMFGEIFSNVAGQFNSQEHKRKVNDHYAS